MKTIKKIDWSMTGQNIKHYLRIRGMTKKRLAEKIDVTPNTITIWMSGRRHIATEYMYALTQALDVTFEQLVVAEGEGRDD